MRNMNVGKTILH